MIRSPRRIAFLSLLAAIFVVIILQQSPWAQEKVYERITLLDLSRPRPENQSPLGLGGEGSEDGPSRTKSGYPPWVTAPARIGHYVPAFQRPADMSAYMGRMLKWARPTWGGHWPPFRDYLDKAYDPNRWEQFEMYIALDVVRVALS